MDDNRLSKYRSDLSQLSDDPESAQEIQASIFHQELNTLKIEKLSNRVTIISVIIPCIIIAILYFVYMDVKEQVVDVEETKGIQVAQLAKTLDEKYNALDVRVAEAKYLLDEKLPEMAKKQQALEAQLAKLNTVKADQKALEAALAKLEARIKTNTDQNKTTVANMERINQDLLAAIKENNTLFKSRADQIKEEMKLFKEEFDARLLELASYEQRIAQLNKSVSLVDKQIKALVQETDKRTTYRIDQLRLTLEPRIKALESAPSKTPAKTPAKAGAAKPGPSTATPQSSPAPQLDTGSEPANPSGISQETLTQ